MSRGFIGVSHVKLCPSIKSKVFIHSQNSRCASCTGTCTVDDSPCFDNCVRRRQVLGLSHTFTVWRSCTVKKLALKIPEFIYQFKRASLVKVDIVYQNKPVLTQKHVIGNTYWFELLDLPADEQELRLTITLVIPVTTCRNSGSEWIGIEELPYTLG